MRRILQELLFFNSTLNNNNNNNNAKALQYEALEKKLEPQVKATDADRWIRPLGIMESYWATVAKFSCVNTVQAVWLSSTQPMDANLLTKAVRDITSQVELLQTCIQRKTFFRLWFRKMHHFQFNFSVTYEEPMTVYDRLLHTRFDLQHGPLWEACISLNPFKRDEAVLLLAVHHSITDGFTNMIIIRDILCAINAMCRHDVVKSTFRPVPPALVDDLMKLSYLPNIVKEGIKNLFLTLIYERLSINPLKVLRGEPGQTSSKVRLIVKEISKDVTDKLIKRCKEAKVTFNCCFMAAARLAMFKLVQQLKPDCKETSITVENLVNMRRYLPDDQAEITGCFISSEGQRFKVTEEDYDNFWRLARKVNDLQSKHLEERVPVKRLNLYNLLPLIEFMNSILTKFSCRNIETCQIGITNMGNMEKFLPTSIESHVKVCNYVRTVSVQHGPSVCLLSCQTLRGKFIISINHSANKLSAEMARTFTNFLMEQLEAIAEYG